MRGQGNIYQRGKWWWVRWSHNGKEYRESSNSTEDLNRRCIGIEIEQRYCDIAIKRLRQESLFFPARSTKAAQEPARTLFDSVPQQETTVTTHSVL